MWSSSWEVLCARWASPSNANRQDAGATETGTIATNSKVHPLPQLGIATATNQRRARRIGKDSNVSLNVLESNAECIPDARRVNRSLVVLSAVLDHGTFRCLRITATIA